MKHQCHHNMLKRLWLEHCVILSGDFRQLLLIKINAIRSKIVNLSIKFNSIWRHFVKFSLTQNIRIYMVIRKKKKFDKAVKCAILFARNVDFDEINKKVVELLDIAEQIYTSVAQ
ncbi:hypothetical protein ACFW04_006601 [Cataglyphis niger]